MDSKEIKAALKAARESIRTKDYKDVLKQCKEVLNHDKNNYNALVFIAVAAEGLDQPDQALKAYQRATESAPSQILAWQGLSGFYEKHPPQNKADLAEVYQKLRGFYKDDKQKLVDVERKLADLQAEMGDFAEALSQYEAVLEMLEDDAQQKEVKAQYAKLLLKQKSLTPAQEDKLLGLLRETLDSGDNVDQAVSSYLSLLVKREADGARLQAEVDRLEEKFPGVAAILELQLLMELDSLMGRKDAKLSDKGDNYVEKLAAAEGSGGGVTSLGQGVAALCRGDYVTARDLLQQGVSMASSIVAGHFFLATTFLHLHDNQSCLKACDTAMKIVQRKDRRLTTGSGVVTAGLEEMKALALLRLGTPEALQEAEQLVSKNDKMEASRRSQLLAHIFVQQDRLDAAEQEISLLPDSLDMKHQLAGCVALARQEVELALQHVQKAIAINAQCSDHHLLLGKVYWAALPGHRLDKAQELCFTSLLKAAKLDPYNPETFLFLGHFYAQVQKDTVKARRCYQKAYDLDPGCEQAGAALCDSLSVLGEEEAAKELLTKVTSEASAGSAKWAWMRLGLHQMKFETPTSAIVSFQATLRADPKDHHIWECLAEAYLLRGSYTASLKAFTKAIELNPESMYCMYQIASIKQVLGQYPEAVEEYVLILDKDPDYVPALKGLGETYLLLAKQRMNQYLNDLARDNCQLAIARLTRAVTRRPDLSCLWKLLGDACCMLHPLSAKNFRLVVPARLLEPKTRDVEEQRSLGKLETLQLGTRCYGRALKVLPECGSLWHDLGLSLLYQSQLPGCPEGQAAVAVQAEKALRKSLSLDPANYLAWISLGFLYCAKYYSRPDLAQHCFIKSILVENNNVVAWTNLGALYLSHGNANLAHEAFKKAQSLEPSYVSCWIGQAIIAETVGHEDAMDLFRHTTSLAIHPEGGQGYAHFVCQVLQDTNKWHTELFRYSIVQMAAIPAACQAMGWYTARIHADPIAYNTYGLLLEQQNLTKSAAAAYLSAVELLSQDPTKAALLKQVQCNAARVLSKLGRHQEAVKLLEQGGALERFQDCCLLALALFHTGDLPRSTQVYQHALKLQCTEKEQSDVYAALGMVCYKFDNMNDTKSMLFKSVEGGTSRWGLQALCALGLLQGDSTLLLAALQELVKLEDTPDSVFLTTVVHLLQGDYKEGRNCILRAVHKHRGWASLRWMLGAMLLRLQPSAGLAIASSCLAARALKSDSAHCLSINSEPRPLSPLVPPGLEGLGLLAAGCHATSPSRPGSLAAAQKAFHLYPDKISTIAGLATAVHAEAMTRASVRSASDLLLIEISFLQFLLQQEDVSTSLGQWARQQLAVAWLYVGRQDQAVSLLAQLKSSEPCAYGGVKLLEILTEDREAVFDVLKKPESSPPLYPLQVLAELYLSEGQTSKAEEALRACLSAHGETSTQPQCFALTKLAHLAFRQLQKAGDNEGARALFDEATEALEKLDPHTPLVPLMKGLLSLGSNDRLAKHLLQKAVESSKTRSSHTVTALKQLLALLSSSKKDPELLQSLWEEAISSGDKEILEFCEKLEPGGDA